ncbi:restriction endonuclease subunit S [Vagococcus lutrae]|uniref:restriction endonuclease subunit S n=1 Tax=Vagococcus lutrae TaxID=81947 RepID=UPI0023A921CD|nr:restriction endonuclease subunit S [Vagococcus lutrae]WEB80818.1 restriction endonuclease subunit S [Vagococcus lutrae]
MKQKATKPVIRFEGFTDDWEQRKLGEELSLLKDGTHGTHKDVNQGPYLLSAKNIKNSKVYISKSERKISFEDYFKIHKNFVLKKNDILLTIVGTIGESALITDVENITFQRSVAYLRPKKIHARFLKTLIDGQGFQNELKRRQVVSAQPGIYLGDLSKICIVIPKILEEQQKIGTFFKQLDDTIALHQRQLEALEKTKKSFLQKMFPKKDETKPELRFAGFTDDWEQRKFFDNISSTIDFRGRTPKKLGMNWSTSGYLALSALNVKNGYIDPLADAHYGDEELYNKWMAGKELKKGHVLFTTEAPMGNVAQVPDDKGYILSQRTIAFEAKEKMMTNDFLAILLKSPIVFNSLSALSSGGTAKGVSQRSLKALSVVVPNSIKEQQKIGTFFKQLDDTIALHQRQLEALEMTKKSFLQKMFI